MRLFLISLFFFWVFILNAPIGIFGQIFGTQDVASKNECRRNGCTLSCSCLISRPKDCTQILQNGCDTNGVYTIYPDKITRGVKVSCDQITDGGGWVVFQRRMDGSVNFNREWVDYKYGFGDRDGEHWLGNELVHIMVDGKPHELRVDMVDFSNETRYAKYEIFNLDSDIHSYRILLMGFNGNAGNSMESNNKRQFSTKDKDFTGTDHTTIFRRGGWWYYNSRALSNLNGVYGTPDSSLGQRAIVWDTWEKEKPLKFTELKFRPN